MSFRQLVSALACLSLFSTIVICRANAQNGTAPSGYYPMGYNGDIFSGEFVPTGGDAKLVKLVYKQGSKTDSFEGMTETTCQAPLQGDPHTAKELHLSAIP